MPTFRLDVRPSAVSLVSSVLPKMMFLPESTQRNKPLKARPSGMWTTLVRPTKLASMIFAAVESDVACVAVSFIAADDIDDDEADVSVRDEE